MTMKNLFRACFVLTTISGIYNQSPSFPLPENWDSLCPYTSICGHKAAKSKIFPNTQKPCCDSCSCDEDCGLRKNCCQYSMDKYRIDERYNTKCTSLTTYNQDTEKQAYVSNMYTIIDQCPDSSSCYDFNVSTIGSMYPVVSYATSMIYLNRMCARCNGIDNAVLWKIELNCKSDSMKNVIVREDLDKHLKYYIESGMCNVRFLPPTDIDLSFHRCTYFPIIRQCLHHENNSKAQQICSSYNSTYTFLISKYANVHCFLCSSAMQMEYICEVKEPSKVSPFSAILTPEDITRGSGMTTYGETGCNDGCRCKNNEMSDRKSGSCRRVRCPIAMLQRGHRCSYVNDEVLAGPFVSYIKLKLLLEEGQSILYSNDVKKSSALHSLFPCELRGWYKSFYIPANSSLLDYMIVRLIYPRMFMNLTFFLEEFKASVESPWHLYINRNNYKMKATIHKHFDYINCGVFNKSIYMPRTTSDNINSMCEELLDDTGIETLEAIYFDFFVELPDVYSLLTRFYFCKHVDLKLDEYEMHQEKMFFKVTNKTFEKAEYRSITSGKRHVFSLCMSDFGEDVWFDFNSSKQSKVYYYYYIIIPYLYSILFI